MPSAGFVDTVKRYRVRGAIGKENSHVLGASGTVCLSADSADVELVGVASIRLIAIVPEEIGAADIVDRGAAPFGGGVKSGQSRDDAKLLPAENSRHRTDLPTAETRDCRRT